MQLQEDTKQKFLFQKYALLIYEAQVQIQTKPLLVSNRYSNPKGQWFAINPHSWKNYFRVAYMHIREQGLQLFPTQRRTILGLLNMHIREQGLQLFPTQRRTILGLLNMHI